MNAREFLAFSEQLIAFNTLMKGDLQKEIDAAQTALSTLDGVKTLKDGQVALEKDKESFESYKESVQKVFDEVKEELSQKDTELSSLKEELNKKQSSLTEGLSTLDTSKEDLVKSKALFDSYVQEQNNFIADALSKIEQQKATLIASEQSISEREAKLEAKLSALKDIG